MIRVLIIGTDAAAWVSRVEPLLPSAEVEAARLPAGGIRAFERSPADVVVLCGSVADGRLTAVVQTLRSKPLGSVLPFVGVCDESLDDVDVQLDEPSAEELVAELLVAVGIRPSDLAAAPPLAKKAEPVASLDTRMSAADIEKKQREVRHETYFQVLGVSPSATGAEIAAAFSAQWRRFEPGAVPADLEQQRADELAEVRDGLEDAYAVLGNERLRAAYAEPRGLR